jgi:hypothetical protein
LTPLRYDLPSHLPHSLLLVLSPSPPTTHFTFDPFQHDKRHIVRAREYGFSNLLQQGKKWQKRVQCIVDCTRVFSGRYPPNGCEPYTK